MWATLANGGRMDDKTARSHECIATKDRPARLVRPYLRREKVMHRVMLHAADAQFPWESHNPTTL